MLLVIAVVGAVVMARKVEASRPASTIPWSSRLLPSRGRRRPEPAEARALIAVAEVTPAWYLVLGSILFSIGAVGLLVRRNPLVMFMCVELMLNAVTLTFVTFSRMLDDVDGQTVVVFVLVVAAAEVVVGLGIIVALLRKQPDSHRRRHQRAEGLSSGDPRPRLARPRAPAGRVPRAPRPRPSAGRARGRLARHRGLRRCVRRHRRWSSSPMLGEDEHDRSHVYDLFDWIHVGGFDVKVGFLADPLSITMALFITGIGTLIHLYSIGYMHGDPKFSKFFVYMNLFVFSMLMLVLGSNMLITFLGWEGVGACSYFLIAFWFSKEANAVGGQEGLRHQPHR